MQSITAAITGVAGYLPEYVLTNKELEELVDTNDEWITTRTGVKERRLLKGEGKGSSVMAIEAVKSLLEKTNTDPLDVELIIVATVTADHQFPATGVIVADKVGAKHAFAYDINAACSGFVYSLVTGTQFIETGKYKKVIVVGVDKMSSIIDYTDRATCVIFGDGAGAVLLEPNSEGLGIQDSLLHSDGSGIEYLHQKNGGSAYPLTEENIGDRDHFVHQEGQQVFKFAVTNMAKVASDIMERNQLTGDDVDWLVPHQANLRIIKATQDRMGVSDDKVMVNIQKYGNTTAGTIPLCLWDYEKQLKKGDNLIIAAFGGGFTWGSIYLKWAYDPK